MTVAARYARLGFRQLLENHELIALAAEAELGQPLEQREDKSVGTVCVWRGPPPQVLVIRQRTHTGEHWGLPKGHPEANENDLDTALRELEEETGVALSRKDAEGCGSKIWAEIKYSYVGKLWEGHWLTHEKYPDEKYRTCVFHKTVRFALVYAPFGAVPPPFKIQAEEVAAAEWLNFDDAVSRLTYGDEREALRELLPNNVKGKP